MEQTIIQLLLGYLVLMSLIGYIIMGIDKKRAVKKTWRIPERTLFLIAFLGGGIGALIGMFAFRHKTRHGRFLVLLPVAAVLETAAIIKLISFLY